MTALLYLYCILPDTDRVTQLLDSRGVVGIDSAEPVLALREAGVVGAVSRVPEDKFQEPTLNQLASSLSDLAPYALRHHEVVQTLFEGAPSIVPIALGAVYRNEDNVRSMLRARSAEFSGLLDKLRGRQEWDLKVFRQNAALSRVVETQSKRLQAMAAEATRTTPGKAYLLLKQREQALAAEVENYVSGALQSIVERMRPHAEEVRTEHFPTVDPEGARLTFKASFLVAAKRAERFRGEAKTLAAEHASSGLEIVPAGPWPPYSFAGRGLAEARG